MAKITVMSYKDTNAPQIVANNRTAFYGLLDVWLKDGYNKKFVKNLYTRPDRTIVLEYAAPHGYKTGHLIKLTGATNSLFNNKFRCISVTSDTMTLRLDKEDSQTYPTTDTSTTIESVVSPADWQQIYSSTTQRTYRSKNTTQSSQLYYTFKEPTNPALKTAGACCYSCDISKEFDVSTGSNLNSFFDYQKTTADGTNFYIITDINTTPLTSTSNGKAGTYLPWFAIATDTFVYFLLGNWVNTTSTYTDPTVNLDYRNHTRNASNVRLTTYYFGDFIPYNPIEYVNKTSAVFSFHQSSVDNTSRAINYFTVPCRWFQETTDLAHCYLVDSYIPQNQITPVSISSLISATGSTYSLCTTSYTPYPMLNTTGFLTSDFYVWQKSSTATNNPTTLVRGYMPFIFIGLNYYTLPQTGATMEGNPFVLEPTGNVYDELIMLHYNGSTESTSAKSTNYGWATFRLD